MKEPTHFGSGWISGVLSVTLGAIGLGAVICFLNPSLFTMPELRAPGRWPKAYGIAGGPKPPKRFVRQFLAPFCHKTL